MLDWLIVGGGLQGSHIARRLATALPDTDIAVLDPQPTALDEWQRRADACGMHYLRSSQAHHLGLRADALRAFAHRHGYDGRHAMGRYRRPSRALFEAHVLDLAAPVTRIRARAETVERNAENWRAVIENGETHAAHNVVLACGPPDVAARLGRATAARIRARLCRRNRRLADASAHRGHRRRH